MALRARLVDALKTSLRSRGMTYRSLAKKIGVSEPTVKRIFHERNCKLDRLMEICAAAEVELENVLGSMNRGPGPANHVAPEIERRLAARGDLCPRPPLPDPPLAGRARRAAPSFGEAPQHAHERFDPG